MLLQVDRRRTDRFRIYLMAFATSLEGQVTTNLTVYATSAFSAHSLVSTVTVVQSIVLCMSTWR